MTVWETREGHVLTRADSKEKLYTYTIITVDSNPQLKFLHDRMPAILEPTPAELSTWLDPSRTTWTTELQDLLRPSSAQLEVYPVSKDVGKVGNNSPSFVIPVASKENKGNIANFFANAPKKGAPSSSPTAPVSKKGDDAEVKKEGDAKVKNENDLKVKKEDDAKVKDEDDTEVKKEVQEPPSPSTAAKRPASPPDKAAEPPAKMPATSPRKTRSATSNGTKPVRHGQEGSQKITRFFNKTG
ncbi:SOS response-associated peptidase family protein [Candidatus Bathyarchaeota archaeon]|nr:SOS response-associated peptidase family protein [Candidatus Bathyarchaeota archaeon]